jgi:hypothetical protein
VSLTYSSAVAGVDKVGAPGGNWSATYPAVTRGDAVQGFTKSERRVATVIIGLLDAGGEDPGLQFRDMRSRESSTYVRRGHVTDVLDPNHRII